MTRHREEATDAWSAMQNITRHLKGVDQQVARLLTAHNQLEKSLAESRREVTRLQLRNAELERAKSDLSRELDELTAGRLRQSPDVSTVANLRHIELVEQFDAYVKQEVPALTYRICGKSDPPPQRQRHIAEITAKVLALVLRDGIVEPAELLRQLEITEAPPELLTTANRVCVVGDTISDLTGGLDNEEGWNFSCWPGQPVNPSTQKQWGGCDPAASVEFVVLPGYQSKNRIHRLQEVFTRI